MENMLKLFGFVGNKISNVIRNANNDGPPDLDELVKDLKSKVNNVFKLKPKNTNNGNGSQPPSNNSGDSGIIKPLPIIIVIFLVWLATGFYIVDQGSRGVVLTFGENTAITLPGPRWHIPYPIETVEIVNQEQVRTIEVGYRSLGEGATQQLKESLMLTGDENIIDLQFAVQYNLKSVEDFLFNNRSVEGSVRGQLKLQLERLLERVIWILFYTRAERRLQ